MHDRTLRPYPAWRQTGGMLRPVVTAVLRSGLIALALVVGGCDENLQTAVITNATDSVIIVYIDYPDRPELDIMRLQPGESHTENFAHPTDGCAPATLIARDSSGVEVDRMDQTFCVGDRWDIRGSN